MLVLMCGLVFSHTPVDYQNTKTLNERLLILSQKLKRENDSLKIKIGQMVNDTNKLAEDTSCINGALFISLGDERYTKAYDYHGDGVWCE